MTNYVCPCDTCGKPVEENDLVYTVASKYDEAGNRTKARHSACHVPMESLLGQLKTGIDKATLLSSQIGAELGRPKPRRTP